MSQNMTPSSYPNKQKKLQLQHEGGISVDSTQPDLLELPAQALKQSKTVSPLPNENYTVGWITALPHEAVAAKAALDECHGRHPETKHAADQNLYILGRIGDHNVVIASLPVGDIGPTSATTAAMHMLSSFSAIRIGLMVGIGAAIPKIKMDRKTQKLCDRRNIRMGDVVVSQPGSGHGGVKQYDFGKAIAGGTFEPSGFLNSPPRALLNAVGVLRQSYEGGERTMFDHLRDILENLSNATLSYEHPGIELDRLFEAAYSHPEEEETCDDCDDAREVTRPTRNSTNPVIHCGVIASGNQVIKDPAVRDRFGSECICFEMEAAGLMNDFPCLVIRGICDYADSHKTDSWQRYAAATAAACAKEILYIMRKTEVVNEHLAREISQAVIGAVDERLQPLHNDREKRESNETLDWLSRSNHEAKYRHSLERCQKGTGQWFLDSPEFDDWFRTPSQTLFCPGIPGAGKTIMESLAIKHLLSYRHSNKLIVVFLYFQYGMTDEQTATSLLAALLRQFSQENHRLPDPISELHAVCKRGQRRPTRDEVTNALIVVAKSYERTFVVVDALDECSEENRGNLLSSIFHLQEKAPINFLATSRPLPGIERFFQDSLHRRLEIRAKEEDIDIYLQSRLRDLPDWAKEDEALQQKIKQAISDAVDGMFLLAQLHFDSLKGKQTNGEIEEALDAFKHPQKSTDSLKIAYDEAIKRIAQQTSNETKWAHKVLSWVVLARRPLTPTELQHALAVRPGDRKLDSKNFSRPANIVSLCAGLVLINQKSNIVQLVHYTTKEYFETNPPDWIQSAAADLARSCLQYLTFDLFACGPCPRVDEFEKRISQNVFLDYAANYWGKHSQGVEDKVKDVAQTFLSNDSYTSSARQAMFTPKSWYIYSQPDPKWLGFHAVSFFGLSKFLQILLKDHLAQNLWPAKFDAKDHFGWTPLSLAAQKGHDTVVKMLIELGERVDVNSKDEKNHQTPLSCAAENGHDTVVKMLIELGERVDVNSKDIYNRTPLSWAAENGYDTVVKMLIELGERVDVDSRDINNKTPLSCAAENGHDTVVKMLIELGERVDVDLRDISNQTPLSCAAENGHDTVVKMLIELGERVDVNLRDINNRTPLSLAARNRHDTVVKMLIELGERVDVNSRDINNKTPLSWAAENGHDTVVKMLIELGERVDVNSRDKKFHQTPLSWAAEKGHDAVVKMLIEHSRRRPTLGGRGSLLDAWCYGVEYF